MKKFIYAITIALAALVLFASCENSFSGTSLNTAPLRETVASGRTNNKGFKITNITGSLVHTKNQVITITADVDNVDWDTLNDALIIYKLKDAADNKSVYVRDGSIVFTMQEKQNSTVSVLVDLSTLTTDHIEIFIDPTKLTAANGAMKLNMDGDRYQGEENDDAYVDYISVSDFGTTTLTPITTGLPRDTNLEFDVAFDVNTYDTNGLVTGVKFNFDRTYGGIGDVEDTTDYKDLFDSAFIVEKYLPVSNSWEKVTITSSTYSTTTGVYEASFGALPDGTVARVRSEKLQDLKSANPIAGYVARYNFDNAATHEIFGTTTSYHATESGYLDVSFGDIFNYSASDSKGYNVSIRLDYKGDWEDHFGDGGLDTATLTKENIKLVSNNRFVDIESIVAEYTDASEKVKTSIVIKLPANFKKPAGEFTLYFGPEVKTLGGKAADETTTVKAKTFGNPANINSEPRGFTSYSGLSW